MIRNFLLAIAIALASVSAMASDPPSSSGAEGKSSPLTIYMIVHRAGSGADDGFRDYLTVNGIDAEFIFRDMQNDRARLPGYVEEIKALKPDLVYTQTTSITRAIVGRMAEADPEKNVLDIPVVFSMVSFPARSKLVPAPEGDDAPMLSKRHFTGVRHVVSNTVRLNAMRTYMDFQKLGMLYDKSSGAQRRTEAAMRELVTKAGIAFVSDSPTEPKVDRDPAQIEPTLRRL